MEIKIGHIKTILTHKFKQYSHRGIYGETVKERAENKDNGYPRPPINVRGIRENKT